jgi:hypothetical protein
VTVTVSQLVNDALGIGPEGFQAIGWLSGIAAVVIFGIALVFSIFRLFFELLKTYIAIILSIVTSPITLMLGALPGSNAFGAWLKALIFNLLVFPAVLLIVIIAILLQGTISQSGGFLPPYIGGIGSGGAVGPLIGLGMILIIPDIVEKLKKMGGGGGVFDQFANNLGSAIKKGWAGGELVPGLGFTNTSKWAGGGVSGQNILRKGAIITGGGAGMIAGGATALAGKPIGTSVTRGLYGGAVAAGRALSDITGDKDIAAKDRKDREAGKKSLFSP